MFINPQHFNSEEIIDFLKRELLLKQIYQELSREKVVLRKAKTHHLVVHPDEIKAKTDQILYEKHLGNASDLFSWLADQMISLNDWESGIHNQLLASKLADHLFGNDIETAFNQRRTDFDQVLLYRIVVPYIRIAQNLMYQIAESEISFYEAAHLYDLDEQRRLHCGYEGRRYRYTLEPEIAEVAFNSRLKEPVGPIPSADDTYNILLIEELHPAQLTSEISKIILDQLFDEWIAHEL